jgi:hypothetical protein
MVMKNTLVTAIVGFFIAAGMSACSIPGISKPLAPDVLEESLLPHRVAILPFANRTSNPEAGILVRKMFYNFFSSLNYRDQEPYLVDKKLKQKNLYQKVVAGEHVSPQKLGQFLGVDAVIYGEVLSLGKIYALVYSENNAGLRARMVQSDTGQIIWELEHSIHLREGDVPLSLTGLAATLVKTAISHQQATHMKAASELCMEMVATIPDPPALTEPPPKIQALVHNGAGKLLRPGDYLKVVMIGDKGQSAVWSIPSLVDDLPMKEKEPGVYIGDYRVRPQDRLPHGRLVGYLISETGVRSQWVDTLGPVKIGQPTVLPPVISEDTLLTVDKSPYLVEEALLVMPNVKLTINPGTVVWFHKLGLIVKGELQILGMKENPVRLGSLRTSKWKGIFFDQSLTENKIYYSKISDAEFGLRASNSNLSIQNCLFQENTWAIVLEEGSAQIHDSLIRTSQKIGIAARKSHLVVQGSTVTENNSGGVLLEESQAQIEQNNISNNGVWQLKVLGNRGKIQAGNNWWGKENPDPAGIIGSVKIKPVLKKPVDFKILE